MNSSDANPVLGLLSRTGPEVPPDIAGWDDERTELLPIIAPSPPPAARRRNPPPRSVAARAVIVYEPEPRRSWGLWVFTAVLVALTAGVVLGQAVNDRPVSRAKPAPVYATPVETAPIPAGRIAPVSGPPLTAPLGSARTRTIEVTGASALLRIRSADLGDQLYTVTTMDGGAVPVVTDTPLGPRLDLTRTDAGPARTEVQLNAKVRWTVRLAGGSTDQQIDLRAGGLAGLELAGSAAHTALDLPEPKGRVALRVTGAVADLQVRAGKGTPVGLRLGQGADVATLDGTTRRNAGPGTALASKGWRSADDRYDISTSVRVGTALVDRAG
jgi:hypothetical protein